MGKASVSGTSATKATAQSRPIVTTDRSVVESFATAEGTVTAKMTAGKSFADALGNKGVIKAEGSFKAATVSHKVAVPQTQNVSLQGVSYADVAKGIKKAPATSLPIHKGKVSSQLSESLKVPSNQQRAGFKSYADALKVPPHYGTNVIPFKPKLPDAIGTQHISQLKATGTHGGGGFKGHKLTAHSKMAKPMTSSLGTTGKNSVKGAQQTGQGLSGKIPSTGAAKSTAKGSAKGRGKGSDKRSAAKGEAKAEAVTEIAEEGAGAYKTVDRFGRQRPDTRLIPDNLKSYIRQVEEKSALKVPQKQLDALANDLRNTQYPRFEKGSAELAAHKRAYKKAGVLDNLKAEWEAMTGQQWPSTPEFNKLGQPVINPSTGMQQMIDYQAHHIVPQQLGGKHEWWNMHPVPQKGHQGGVHGRGSHLNQIVKELNK